MKKHLLIFLFAIIASLCMAQQADSIQISELQLEVKKALLDIEKAEIDRRVEYLQHEQNKFLTVTGIILAILGLGITIVLFLAGYFMNKSLGAKFDSKELDMENRMKLLEDRTALRLEKLNLEAKSYEKSLDIIQLKIDEAVRQAVEKVENKTEDETEKFKVQIQKIASEAKGALEDIRGHSDRAKDLVEEIQRSKGKLSPKLKKEVEEQVEKIENEKTEKEYNPFDWYLAISKDIDSKELEQAIVKVKQAISKYPELWSYYYIWNQALIAMETPSESQIQDFKDALEKNKKNPKLKNEKHFIKIYKEYFPQQ